MDGEALHRIKIRQSGLVRKVKSGNYPNLRREYDKKLLVSAHISLKKEKMGNQFHGGLVIGSGHVYNDEETPYLCAKACLCWRCVVERVVWNQSRPCPYCLLD